MLVNGEIPMHSYANEAKYPTNLFLCKFLDLPFREAA